VSGPTRDARRQELLELILEVSFRRQKVTLASGKQSDFYLDLRQTLMRPRGVRLAGELVLEQLALGPAVDAVGGMAVGAVPLVSAVLGAAAAADAATPLLGFFVRKEKKGHLRYNHPKKAETSLWILSVAFLILLVAWFGVNYLPSAQNSVHVYGS
jgi:hypothetical protein